jgi:hypothetical protein
MKAMRGRIALQKHFLRNPMEAPFHRFAAAFGVRARPRGALCSAYVPPRPACGERTEVRGLVDPLSETALVSKIILRESRFQRW